MSITSNWVNEMAHIHAEGFAVSPKGKYSIDKFFDDNDTYEMVQQSKSVAGRELVQRWDPRVRNNEVVGFRDGVKSNPYKGIVAIGAPGQTIFDGLGTAFGALYNAILQIKTLELNSSIRTEIHRTLSLGFDPSERMRVFAQGLRQENDLREALTEQILSWPTLEANDVYQRLLADAEPFRLRSELIGLPVEGKFVYPEFQFHSDASNLREEVKAVNQELGAVDDPWGVADWWLSENEWLDTRPVDLLEHRRAYSKLLAAARAATEEV